MIHSLGLGWTSSGNRWKRRTVSITGAAATESGVTEVSPLERRDKGRDSAIKKPVTPLQLGMRGVR